MGNNCVGPKLANNGFLQSVTAAVWKTNHSENLPLPNEGVDTNSEKSKDADSSKTDGSGNVQGNPPPHLMINGDNTQMDSNNNNKNVVANETVPDKPVEGAKTKPTHVRRTSSLGVQIESVLGRKTGNIKEIYSLGRKLGQGQFGTTFLCISKSSNKEYACKSIAKRRLTTEEDVEDVRREIQIMHHLAGQPSVVQIVGAYEDAVAVHVVMELCAGGELFDRILQRGHYSEKKAAELARVIVGVVEACHSLGVMHRDLKPENFLFVNEQEESPLKTIDFGLSVFFKPGETFSDVVGSPYYVAPEVLRKHYGLECDIWSAGVIIYILLSGVPPFWDESEQGIFEQVLKGELDFASEPWPAISESAKDLVRKMLVRDPKKRLTAHEVLCHPWVRVGGVAPDKPLDCAVLSRLNQFSAMNKLKKIAVRVIAESLSGEEIAGLKEMFKMIDADNSGHITLEELKTGLEKVGANLKDSEIVSLMQAADIDNSGTIDYGEFIAAMLHLNKIQKEDHMYAAFSYFDEDGSGYITKDELQNACDKFGLSNIPIDELMREVDQDNDGRIDYSEFVAMMQDTGFGEKGSKRVP
ncbi:calcium-dependent protein kinase 20-like [Lycium barbarum]|uniref:calcium-dependent protein kinase 20-like n=1 Tax=Lycium barbarum TaxID=112863 RepID=UPI00293E3088|nr:calcium-dependent protein kinase 20-like [Lycium barbarum]